MLRELGVVEQRYQAVREVLNDGASVTDVIGDAKFLSAHELATLRSSFVSDMNLLHLAWSAAAR